MFFTGLVKVNTRLGKKEGNIGLVKKVNTRDCKKEKANTPVGKKQVNTRAGKKMFLLQKNT